MSSISRLYAEIFNFPGISTGYGGAFPETHKYHQQDLMGDEVLVTVVFTSSVMLRYDYQDLNTSLSLKY